MISLPIIECSYLHTTQDKNLLIYAHSTPPYLLISG